MSNRRPPSAELHWTDLAEIERYIDSPPESPETGDPVPDLAKLVEWLRLMDRTIRELCIERDRKGGSGVTSVRYQVAGGHTHVRIWINNGVAGNLVLRNEEFEPFLAALGNPQAFDDLAERETT